MLPNANPKEKAVLFHANDFDYDEFVAAQEDGPTSNLPAMMPTAEAEALLAQAAGDANWDAFYQRETDPYKPRRYLTAEFPELLQTEVADTVPKSCTAQSSLPQWLPKWLRGFGNEARTHEQSNTRAPLLLDVGCGYGSALLPLLKENKHLRAVACDLSATAIGLLKTSLKSAPSFETRVRARAWDITQGPPSELLPPSSLCTTTENGSNETAAENSGNSTAAETADLALLVFTLSAVNPALHVSVLKSLAGVLTPGTGIICFRDRARYDKTMLRSKRRIGDSTYARDDGTLAHYFTTEEITALAAAAGLELLGSAEYCTVRQPNRRKGTVMNSCYVHAKMRRPHATAAAAAEPPSHEINSSSPPGPEPTTKNSNSASASGSGSRGNGNSAAGGDNTEKAKSSVMGARATPPWAFGLFTVVLAAASAALTVNMMRKQRTRF